MTKATLEYITNMVEYCEQSEQDHMDMVVTNDNLNIPKLFLESELTQRERLIINCIKEYYYHKGRKDSYGHMLYYLNKAKTGDDI